MYIKGLVVQIRLVEPWLQSNKKINKLYAIEKIQIKEINKESNKKTNIEDILPDEIIKRLKKIS